MAFNHWLCTAVVRANLRKCHNLFRVLQSATSREKWPRQPTQNPIEFFVCLFVCLSLSAGQVNHYPNAINPLQRDVLMGLYFDIFCLWLQIQINYFAATYSTLFIHPHLCRSRRRIVYLKRMWIVSERERMKPHSEVEK